MSTRSCIAIERPDKKVESIYCHFDGYPDGVGYMLYNYYNDREKVNDLIELGDLSALRMKLYPNPKLTHTFDKPQSDVCIFYGRDRQNEDCGPCITPLRHIKKYSATLYCDYLYLYGLDGKWKFACIYSSARKWKDLETWLQNNEETL